MSGDGDFRLLIIPADGSETRSWDLSMRRVRLLKAAAWLAGVVLVVGVASWGWLAFRSSQLPALRARVAELESEQARVAELASQLELLEERYGAIRGMFGVDSIPDPSDLWLPPPDRPSRTAPADPSGSAPIAWPLSRPGFVTQPLLDGADAEHPGLDIAVPTDTWIRAAGAGVVVAVGEDPVYGHFVRLDHGEGLTTLYGHASLTTVRAGQRVRRNEVIGLSGSSGRSTAPHLHFEVRLDGEPVDPLEYVRQPG